jgi:hypothetical protein
MRAPVIDFAPTVKETSVLPGVGGGRRAVEVSAAPL